MHRELLGCLVVVGLGVGVGLGGGACSSTSSGGGAALAGTGGTQPASGTGGLGQAGQTATTTGGMPQTLTPGTGGGGSGGQTAASGSGGTGTGGAMITGTGGTSIDAGSGGQGASGGASGGRSPAFDGGASPATDAGTGTPQTFVCSSVLGLMLTSQWYTGGFETAPGIDNARWQLKWMEHAYIDEWANVNSTFWGITPVSPCAQNSDSPDRVVLIALSWTITTLAEWESNVTKDVENIKVKYPNVKQIVLMTIVRGPGNKSCGNTTVVAENTLVPAYIDQALADVAAKDPTLVKVGPKAEGASCADFMGTGPHLTAAGDMAVAKVIAAGLTAL